MWLEVSRENKITNILLCDRVKEKRTILLAIRKRRLKWIGYVLRYLGMLEEVLEKGKSEVKGNEEDHD